MPREPRFIVESSIQRGSRSRAGPTVDSELRSSVLNEEDLEVWAREVTDEMEETVPFISTFSTLDGPNESGLSGRRGQLGLETGSSATSTLWVFTSASSVTGAWEAIQ